MAPGNTPMHATRPRRRLRLIVALALLGIVAGPEAVPPATAVTPTQTAIPAQTTVRALDAIASVQATIPIRAAASVLAAAIKTAAPNCAVQRCIALTFDDGPGPYTNQLLDELKARKTRATFFVVGQMVATRPQVVARIVHDGHALGNHSWNHPDLTKLSDPQINTQIANTNAKISWAAGVRPTLMRPPYGATNPRVLGVIKANKQAAILWSVDTEDWKNRSATVTTKRALAGAKPGAIILMHDLRPTTVRAIPGIIDALRAKGYTLVTVPQLLGATTPGRAYYSR